MTDLERTKGVDVYTLLTGEIVEYFKDARIGTPKIMALWDVIEEETARLESLQLPEKITPAWLRNITHIQAVRSRVNGRTTEIPGYALAYSRVHDFRCRLRSTYSEPLHRTDLYDAEWTAISYLTQIRRALVHQS